MGNANCKSSNKKTVIVKEAQDDVDGAPSTKQPTNNTEETTIPSSIKDDNFAIPIKIYTPSSKPIRAAVFFVHGGIFSYGDCNSHPAIAHGLASLGLVVVTASFRNGEEAPIQTNITMNDLNDVIDFVRRKWKNVPFGLVGSSSVSFIHLYQC